MQDSSIQKWIKIIAVFFISVMMWNFTVTDCNSGRYCCDCAGLCYSFDADNISEANQKCDEWFFGMTCMMFLYEGNYVCSYNGPFVGETCTYELNKCLLEEIYGEDSEEVENLRNFRDDILSQSPEGQELIKIYYEWSPAIVKAMEEDEEFKEEVKEMLDKFLSLPKVEVE